MKPRRGLAVGLIAALSAAVAITITGGTANADAVPNPAGDAFYTQAHSFAGSTHGQVLKSREVGVNAAGIPLPFAAYQVQYVSAGVSGVPQANVATILKPLLAKGTPKLVSYQPAIDSLSYNCDPSYQLRTGASSDVGQIGTLLSRGWTVVVPDFLGPDHQWAAGYVEGQGTLDGIRAAENFAPAGLDGSRTPVALIGYSGGARGTEFANELAPRYAPELSIVGAAPGGLAADIRDVMHDANGGVFSGVIFAALFGLDRAYPSMGVNAILNDKGKQLRNAISGMCIYQYTATYAFQRVETYTIGGVDPLNIPAIESVFAENRAGSFGAPKAPSYFYTASADELVVPANVDKLVNHYCAEGLTVDSVKEPGDHASVQVTGFPGAVNWIADRFAGRPAPSAC